MPKSASITSTPGVAFTVPVGACGFVMSNASGEAIQYRLGGPVATTGANMGLPLADGATRSIVFRNAQRSPLLINAVSGGSVQINYDLIYKASSCLSLAVAGNEPPFVGPLDAYTADLVFAGSPGKLLVSAYAGDVFRMRRSSDSTEQSFGSVDGLGDIAAAQIFVGAGNGFYSILYNQVTSSNDLAQASASSQPQGISSGMVLEGSSGLPVLSFDGADDLMKSAVNAGPARTLYLVGKWRAKTVSSQCAAAFNGDSTFNAELFLSGAGPSDLQYFSTELAGVAVLTGSVVTNEGVYGVSMADTSNALIFGQSLTQSFDPHDDYNNALLTIGANSAGVNHAGVDVLAVALYSTNHDTTTRNAIIASLEAAFL